MSTLGCLYPLGWTIHSVHVQGMGGGGGQGGKVRPLPAPSRHLLSMDPLWHPRPSQNTTNQTQSTLMALVVGRLKAE